MIDNLTNWAGNYQYGAARLHAPETVEQVQELVSRASRVKVLGTRHSFNGVADTTGDLLSLEHLDGVLELNSERQQVTVEGGIRYGELARFLHHAGYGLPNLASLPHISVAGAVATATHGSGDHNGNLATSVAAMEVVTANGEVRVLSREHQGEHFIGAVVSLGGLGVVTKLTLDIVPTFRVRQDVYENLPLSQLEEHFDAITSSAYSVSLFTHWQNSQFHQVWLKRLITDDFSFEPEPRWFGATLAAGQRHPLAGMPVVNCTEQMGVPGPWHQRLPHFRLEFTPSSGQELQTEYLVPRQHAVKAIHAVDQLHEEVRPLLQVSEVRTVAADTLWMSPCYGQSCIGIHFTWKPDWPSVKALLPLIESQLAPFEARPHWGKLFTMSATNLQSLYRKLPDFRQLLLANDPEGKFHNRFLEHLGLGR